MKYPGIIILALTFCAGVVAAGAQEKPALATTAKAAVQYTCPMHPDVKSDSPGTCPKCGMKLVKATGNAMASKKSGNACCGCCASMKGGKGMKSKMECSADTSNCRQMKQH